MWSLERGVQDDGRAKSLIWMHQVIAMYRSFSSENDLKTR